MHHYFSNSLYGYSRVTRGSHYTDYTHTCTGSTGTPLSELIKLIVLGVMLASPFVGTLLGGLFHLWLGATLEPLSLPLIGQTLVYSRIGLGAFAGLLFSATLGAVTVMGAIVFIVLKAFFNRVLP